VAWPSPLDPLATRSLDHSLSLDSWLSCPIIEVEKAPGPAATVGQQKGPAPAPGPGRFRNKGVSMTPIDVLPGAEKSTGRFCGRGLLGRHAIPPKLHGRRLPTKNSRSCSAVLAVAVLLAAPPAEAQESAERARFEALVDTQPLVGKPHAYVDSMLGAKAFALETRYRLSGPESLGRILSAEFALRPPHVVLSVGEFRVPDFARLRYGDPGLESLLLQLRSAGIRDSMEVVETQDQNLSGRCQFQSPAAGQRLRAGGTLMLRYALRPIRVPIVAGMLPATAEQVIKESGFGFQAYDTTVRRREDFGRVVVTEPASGQELLPGRTVLVWVGRRPPVGWWFGALVTLVCLGVLAAGIYLLLRRFPGLPAGVVAWFARVVRRVERVPATPPPSEVPGLTEQDVEDLKHLLPSLKIDRGVITRLEKEVFELRAEVKRLTEQQKPESVAAETPKSEPSAGIIKAYNDAIASASPVGFLEKLRPVSVALTSRKVVDAGVPPTLEFTESHAGRFLLIRDEDRWLLFPKQGLIIDHLADIEQCFAVEAGSQEAVNQDLVQFVRRPALCEEVKKGWVLIHKGHLYILGLPPNDELAV